MATELATAYVSIVPETKGLARDLKKGLTDPIDKAGKKGTDSLNKGLSGVGSTIGKVGGAVAGAGIALMLRDSVVAASDLAESTSKTQVVFGTSATAVKSFAKDSASAMGMATQVALEYSATFGNLFVSMGLAQGRSADMSTTMVQLASDLASFNNTTTDDALLALRSGLVGETEPLRRFGVNLNDATIRQEALAQGLIKTTSDALSPAVKAQAAYGLILKQTRTAQGDFARTSDGMANSVRIANAELANAKAELGQSLAPATAKAAREGAKLLRVFNDMPDAAQSAAIGITATGTAALLAAPYLMGAAKAVKAVWVAAGASGALGAVRVGFALVAEGATLAQVSTLGLGSAIGGVAALAAPFAAVLAPMIGLALWSKRGSDAAAELDRQAGYTIGTQQKWYQTTAQNAAAISAQTGAVTSLTTATQSGAAWMNTHASATSGSASAAGVAGGAQATFAASAYGATDAVDGQIRSIRGLMTAQDTLAGTTRSAKDAELDYRAAVLDASDADRTVTELKRAGKTGTEAYSRALIAAESAHLRLGDSAAVYREKQHAANVALITGSSSTKTLSADQASLAGRLNAATDKVSSLKAKLETVPKSKKSEVKADIAKAEKNVAKIKKEIAGVKDRTVKLNVDVTVSQRQRFLSNVPILAHPIKEAFGDILPSKPGGTLAVLAEAGHDEAAIPLYPSARNRMLAGIAARATGLDVGVAQGGGITINGMTVQVPDGKASTFVAGLVQFGNRRLATGA